jgi:hypothetical protein
MRRMRVPCGMRLGSRALFMPAKGPDSFSEKNMKRPGRTTSRHRMRTRRAGGLRHKIPRNAACSNRHGFPGEACEMNTRATVALPSRRVPMKGSRGPPPPE